jgi:chemotaxis protein CheY-P-specific phosphatase CheC
MIEAVRKATKSFCEDIVGLEVCDAKYVGKNFYGAAIALIQDKTEIQWYLLFKKDTLNQFAKALLFEDSLKEDDLDDLVKEVANMIIGSAKVILEKNSKDEYQLTTPDFLGHVPDIKLLKLEEYLLYKIKNRTFVIGKKTLG